MTLAKLLTASCIAATSLASQAQSCPAAGSRYVIKGFTGDTPVTATGAALDPKWGCKWNTEDNRDLWWKMGADVVPAGGASSKPASANAASGASGGPLQPGRVYTCTLPGIGMFTGAYFGIVDRNTYRDVNSKRGSYQYDSQSGVLRLMDWLTSAKLKTISASWTRPERSPGAIVSGTHCSVFEVAGNTAPFHIHRFHQPHCV